MILNNKSRRNNSNNNGNNIQNTHFNPSPTNMNNTYFNEQDTFFNESQFQPAAQSTYYQPPTPHHQQPQQPNKNFYDPNQSNINSTIYNPSATFSATPQPDHDGKMPLNQQQQQQQGLYNPANMNQLFQDPMANMAMNYGAGLAGQGKDYVAQNVDKWFSVSKLKFYFAVDTTYVAKKLLLILFPFINKDWSVKYSQAEAVPPKLDVNAPDLYIPIMSFVTYILMLGICLGTQEKFSPEILGIHASSALGWFTIEVVVIFIMMQIFGIKSALKTFDIMSFCGYKYFGMILCLAVSLILPGTGYLIVLAYMCIAITYFMVRNLKLMILASENDPQNNQVGQYQQGVGSDHLSGNKRRIYVLLFISLLQPVFMWWLTRNLVQ